MKPVPGTRFKTQCRHVEVAQRCLIMSRRTTRAFALCSAGTGMAMVKLPTGTVAFLFTDIEGSTQLWERNQAAMRLAVARHDALLAEVIAAHGGILYKHVGDAAQAAFDMASEALAAAVEAQRALSTESSIEIGPLRTRMALHAGEAVPNMSGDYHQIVSLNRLSRLLTVGHGGQILLTEAVRRLLDGALPVDTRLKDLGEHRLR